MVLKFRMLVRQSLHELSLEAPERLVRNRLSWMRFCGLSLADPVPNANTLWNFREALIRADVLDEPFQRLDHAINMADFLPRGGQIVNVTMVTTSGQCNSDGEKDAIKEGRTATKTWPDSPPRHGRKISMPVGQ